MDAKGLVTDLLLALLRHALTGGGLLGIVLAPDDLTKIAAVVPVLVGSALSALDKLKKHKQLAATEVKP